MIPAISSQIQKVIAENPNLRVPPAEMNKCREIAKMYLQKEPSRSWFIKRAIVSTVHAFLVALERFLMKIGLLHLFQEVVSPAEIDAKGNDMILLSTIFSTLTTTLIPVLGPSVGGLCIGGIAGTLLLLSFSYPWWRPFPTCMPRVENWTEKFANGEFEAVDTNKELLDKIANSLKCSPVLLVGKEGSGKTETIKAFVNAIDRGDYPQLSGNQVFYVNTADLLNSIEWVPLAHSPLSYLSHVIDGHREKIIFVFDQIHLSCDLRGEFPAEQLKTMLDFPKNHFPKFIGIADQEKAEKVLETNPGFINRFRTLILDPSIEEKIKVLTLMKMKLAPDMLVDDNIYRLIAEKSSSLRDAIRILKRSMELVSTEFLEERQSLMQMKQYMYSLLSTDEKRFAALHNELVPKLEKTLILKSKNSGIELVLNESIVKRILPKENSSP